MLLWQSLNFTKEMLFPSIRYKRELQVTMERLEAVERELQTLKHDKVIEGSMLVLKTWVIPVLILTESCHWQWLHTE